MAPPDAAKACALAAGLLLALTGCGGSGSAAPAKADNVMPMGDQLDSFVKQVNDMGMVEWSGQLLTKSPAKGGKQIFELSGRFSDSTGFSELSMDSSIDGNKQQVDYLVIGGRTYFNSEVWGPTASDCWADITDDPARTWGLPTHLDPTWPVRDARATALNDDGVRVAIPAEAVLTGMPRGLFPTVPAALDDIEANGVIIPHGPLLEVGVDVAKMWADVPAGVLANIDTKRAGWWTMTVKQARDGTTVQPPKHLFNPAVTPPTQCKKG